MPPLRPKPVVLIICDGFGIAPKADGNAVTRARTPNLDRYIRQYPAMTLRASGAEVGLSWGEMGNSEVGHLTIGAGRVYYQMLPRINQAIETGVFFSNKAFLEAIDYVKESGGTLHIAGLMSAGRVHGMDTHCFALLELAKQKKVKHVAVHAFLDGRDTLYNAGVDFITELLAKMKTLKVGKLASMVGRAFAMDRDGRYERTEAAYEAMLGGKSEGEKPSTLVQYAEDPLEALKVQYQKEVYDEQFPPTVLTEDGEPIAPVEDGDAIIFFNYRPDRMRQMTHAFVDEKFSSFPRTKKQVFVATMTEYEEGLPVAVAFSAEHIVHTLAETLSNAGLSQFHIAETEKYAHVTFFLNGTREAPFPKEERTIIPSPHVPSYDQEPEMSAREITKRVVQEIEKERFDAMIVNFANADMVGHTGNVEATVKAVETIDACIGQIVDTVDMKQGVTLITADHGNAEEVLNIRTGDMDKEHSTNPVPFLVVGHRFEGVAAASGPVPDGDLSLVPPVGMLADIAPTMLTILGVEVPKEMTGRSLV